MLIFNNAHRTGYGYVLNKHVSVFYSEVSPAPSCAKAGLTMSEAGARAGADGFRRAIPDQVRTEL